MAIDSNVMYNLNFRNKLILNTDEFVNWGQDYRA
jgi:hypothetical protein